MFADETGEKRPSTLRQDLSTRLVDELKSCRSGRVAQGRRAQDRRDEGSRARGNLGHSASPSLNHYAPLSLVARDVRSRPVSAQTPQPNLSVAARLCEPAGFCSASKNECLGHLFAKDPHTARQCMRYLKDRPKFLETTSSSLSGHPRTWFR
jgi:hypothetical protein